MHTILVVDDCVDTQDMLEMYFQSCGFAVEKAGDGSEAIQKATTLRPAAILMNVAMPNMSGLEATRRIKSHPELGRVIIIAVSGNAYQSDRDRALEAGCDAWITKPYDLRTVADMLKQVTTGKFVPAQRPWLSGRAFQH